MRVLGEPPALAAVVIERANVENALVGAFSQAPAVELIAGAGSGKTTAAVLYANKRSNSVTWVTLTSELSAHELETELDRAVRESASASKEEDDRRDAWHTALVVIDNAEIIADRPDIGFIVDELLQRIGSGPDVLLLTQRHLGAATGELILRGLCSVMTADDLLITKPDVVELARKLTPSRTVDSEAIVQKSVGWIAGAVLLMRFDCPMPTTVSPILVDYIESSVLDVLPTAGQDLLLAGALLGRITRHDSAGLLSTHGERIFAALRGSGLPMLRVEGDTLVYGPMLRACLLEILPRRYSTRLSELRRRFAFYLSNAGRFDDAVEWSMGAGEPQLAVEALEAGIRCAPDLAVFSDRVERWSGLIGESYVSNSDVLTACLLRALHARRSIERAVTLIHQLEEDSRMDNILAVDPGIIGIVLWTLHSRPGEAEHYAQGAQDNHRADAVRFMLAATSGIEPALPPLDTRWENMAPIVHWGMLWQGRCDDIVDSLGSLDSEDNPNVVLASLWTGRMDVAESALERIPEERSGRPHAEFARAAIAIAKGNCAEARQILRKNADEARRTGGQNHFEVLAAWATLKSGAPAEAAALRQSLIDMDGGERRAISEWARLVVGVALLELDHPNDAMMVLRPAVDSMCRARRHLMLPAAGYALAEAYVRMGDDVTAASVLADIRRRAGTHGSSYWAEEVLQKCPRLQGGMLLNQLAVAEVHAEPEFPQFAASAGSTEDRQPFRVELLPFHEPPLIVVDGVGSSARRLKVVELIADLSQHPDGIERSRLQERLFPEVGRSKGGNHFRQIVFRLRELTGVRLERRNATVVAWPESVNLIAADRQFEAEVLRARTVSAPTDADMQVLREALDLAPGLYLPGSDLTWVEERRTYLSVLFEEAVTKLLWWAVEAGDIDLVRQYGARVLDFNPFSEEIYGLLIRAENLGGNRIAAMAIFQRAHAALGELGLEPGPDLRRLVQGGPGLLSDRASSGRASR
ncbi:BTAD domain-containing putative transcriptional regulator [Rhodococcus sp. OK302]|uniref:BTAD domain-containing putative transcriptional regulator n=1 Tax=Rhodococcus sp. OK302 TaxID=1882769 RepID=UPI000B943A08|nr:BTAD domain-containing putative transcriptional regulator [Rhodococcus sp. OK302]